MGSDSGTKSAVEWRTLVYRATSLSVFLCTFWLFLATFFTVEDIVSISDEGGTTHPVAHLDRILKPASTRRTPVFRSTKTKRGSLEILSEAASQLKIYVYDFPDYFNIRPLKKLKKKKKLKASFFEGGADIYFHQRLLQISALRTENPEEADFFFVPIYGSALSLYTSNSKSAREKIRQLYLKGIERLKKEPYWERNGGRDHIFVFTHTFGFCLGNPLDDWEKETDLQTTLSKEMGNSIFLSYFGEDGRCFNAEKDIVIPPAVNLGKAIINLNNFRKTRLAQHKKEKGTKSRRQLVLMAGKTQLEKDGDPWYAIVVLYGSYDDQTRRPHITPNKHGCWDRPDLSLEKCVMTCDAELNRDRVFSRGVRQKIHQAFRHDKRYKHVSKKVQGRYLHEMRSSVFCLSPRGLAPWDINTYEAALMGCIPIIVADGTALPFENILPWKEMSYRLNESDISRLFHKLHDDTNKKWIEQAQNSLKKYFQAFSYTKLKSAKSEFWKAQYGLGKNGPDAFEYTMMMLAQRKLDRNLKSLKLQMTTGNVFLPIARKTSKMLHTFSHFSPYVESLTKPHPVSMFKPITASSFVQGTPLLHSALVTYRAVRDRQVAKFLSPSSFPRRALVFRGRTGVGMEDASVIFEEWKLVTIGNLVSELNIVMSFAIEDITESTLAALSRTSDAWGGYVSVGIVAMAHSVSDIASTLAKRFPSDSSKILFSIVNQRELNREDKNFIYPMNLARNAALSNVLTEYVLLWDNGILMSPESEGALQRTKKSILTWNERSAIVVPVFEFTTASFAGKGVPSTKHNLVWNIKNEELQPFGMIGDSFKYATHATNHDLWYESKKSVRVKYEIGYQPMLLLRTPALPFDETFYGSYLSKMHYAYELNAAGYELLVHSTAFAVTINAGVSAREQANADLTNQWTIPWSCWRDFTDRIKREYNGFYFPEPCWMSKEVWPVVNERHRNHCVHSTGHG